MDWVCYRSHFPEGYFLFLDQVLTEPRRGIPSVALTAGSWCCFAAEVVFLDVLASIRSRGWPNQYWGLTTPLLPMCSSPSPPFSPLPPQILEINWFPLLVWSSVTCGTTPITRDTHYYQLIRNWSRIKQWSEIYSRHH